MAEKAGVSIGTVDRVLHNRGEVSAATKEKILSIINDLDYRPNFLASSLASKKETSFAVLLPKAPTKESYWTRPLSGIDRAAEELAQFGVKLDLYLFDTDGSASFNEKTVDILENPPAGVLLAPWISREAKLFTSTLDALDIPYVYIDSNLKETHPVSYIGQNSFQSGYLAAKLLNYGLPEERVFLLIHIGRELDNQNHLHQREQGFFDYFKEKSIQQKVIKMEIQESEAELKQQIAAKGLAPEKIDCVYVTNSRVHIVAEYFSKLGLHPRILGYDLIPPNVKMLKKDAIDFLICQNPEEQGYNALNALFDHVLRKQPVEKEHFTSIDIITRENLDYYSAK
nr:LacI family DNA-binding transcriptional regulator [Prolixibacter denitrificans]